MVDIDTVKTLAKRTALLVLVADMVHCYRFITNYYSKDEDDLRTEQDLLVEDALVLERYENNCAPESIVSKQEFELRVKQALEYMETDADGQDVLKHRLEQPYLKLNREAIIFAGGGRAAFMQLAHPFVAAGIRDHSYLQNGVSRRFLNTFKYMFGLTFGDGPQVVTAAKGIRGLHAKVHGEINETVGVFSPQAKFDANQKDAMRYVQWTLVETQIFEYELHVGWLSEADKDSIARHSAKYLLLFGVPMEQGEEEITYKQFKRRLEAFQRSKLATVSDTALDTQEFILLPPAPMYAPLMNFVKWSTLVSLPPRLAVQFGGRQYDTWLDRAGFGVMHGLIRFVYRLCPGSFRYLGAYWGMYERAYGQRDPVSRFISKLAELWVKAFLAILMPDRDADEAIAAVKAIRAQRIGFEKVDDSPLMI